LGVTAFLGKSGITPAKGAASGSVGIGSNIVLAIAAPLFAVLLLIMISLILDWPIAGNSQACFPPRTAQFAVPRVGCSGSSAS